MRRGVGHAMALAGVTLVLAVGCSKGESASTTAAAGVSASSAPAASTTVAPPATTSATTSPTASTAPAGPLVAEAGGWRLVITAPTTGATIGPAVDLCYMLTGPGQASVAFEVALLSAATGSPSSSDRVSGAVGAGSARVNLGSPDPRFYDMTIQAVVNGQPIAGLAVRFFVRFGTAAPAGCP